MKINNKEVIKFTKDDIKSVRLDSHKYDTWATITLKTGVEIRSHSFEFEQLVLDKYKSMLRLVQIYTLGYQTTTEKISSYSIYTLPRNAGYHIILL